MTGTKKRLPYERHSLKIRCRCSVFKNTVTTGGFAVLKKKEFITVLLLLLAAALCGILLHLFAAQHSGSIEIQADGKSIGIFSLDEDQQISIGDSNICEIADGKARMIFADCPDQICIHQGAIDMKGGVITCLPNRVVIHAIGADAADSVS